MAESNYSVHEELQQLELAKNTGVVYVLGKTTLKTNKSTGPFEGLLIDKLYRFLQNNCRSTMYTFNRSYDQFHRQISITHGKYNSREF